LTTTNSHTINQLCISTNVVKNLILKNKTILENMNNIWYDTLITEIIINF